MLAVSASASALACNGGTRNGSARVIRITERDFHISAPKQIAAGDVALSVENRGPDDHELIVAKAGRSHLPDRDDGLTIDEDAIDSSVVGALEPGEPGTRRLRVHLTPGRYVVFCNMAGHYLGGMNRKIEVR
jgi:uncharacterized cupredoxin-like copper-binding protein